MAMRYYWGLGVGHLHAHHPASLPSLLDVSGPDIPNCRDCDQDISTYPDDLETDSNPCPEQDADADTASDSPSLESEATDSDDWDCWQDSEISASEVSDEGELLGFEEMYDDIIDYVTP
jgi:hypothetical protein